jgi:hypothetical protein
MLRRFALAVALFVLTGLLPVHAISASGPSSPSIMVAQASLPPLFDTENAAQAHCPKDVVVWLNIPSGIYHYKGERWYGHTKHGAYACEKEAIKAGDRASLNGQ